MSQIHKHTIPANIADRCLSKIRSKAEQALKQSRYRLGETGDAIAKQTRVAAARADEYVRENPWTGVGIGAAIGVVLGVLLSRR